MVAINLCCANRQWQLKGLNGILHTFTHTFSLSHTLTHTHTLSLSLTHTHTHAHTRTHTYAHALSYYSLARSLSLSHAHKHTHSPSLSQTHTNTHAHRMAAVVVSDAIPCVPSNCCCGSYMHTKKSPTCKRKRAPHTHACIRNRALYTHISQDVIEPCIRIYLKT